MNGKNGRPPVKIKKFHYPKEYANLKDKASEYDFAVMELEEDLSKIYGFLGIDTRTINIGRTEEIELCGYPGDKEAQSMWSAKGSC